MVWDKHPGINLELTWNRDSAKKFPLGCHPLMGAKGCEFLLSVDECGELIKGGFDVRRA